jgi:hypothetical protein
MKAILEFSLPEDREDFVMADSGSDLYAAISEYSNRLRGMYKHENIGVIKTFDARQLLFDILREYNINIDLIS